MQFSDPVTVEEKPKFNWKEFHNHFLVVKATGTDEHLDEEKGKTSPVVVANVWIFDKYYELVRAEEGLWVFAASLREYLAPNIREKHPTAYRINTAERRYRLDHIATGEAERLLKAYNELLGEAPF